MHSRKRGRHRGGGRSGVCAHVSPRTPNRALTNREEPILTRHARRWCALAAGRRATPFKAPPARSFHSERGVRAPLARGPCATLAAPLRSATASGARLASPAARRRARPEDRPRGERTRGPGLSLSRGGPIFAPFARKRRVNAAGAL